MRRYRTLNYLLRIFFGVALFVSAGSSAFADAVLTLIHSNGGSRVEQAFTLADLDALPQTQITTANEFADGKNIYSGPLARDFIALAGETDVDNVTITAINDYIIEIPLSDFLTYDVVLTTRMNGTLLSRRDKGPIWIMYPMDDNPELRNPIINARLVWQTKSMELK